MAEVTQALIKIEQITSPTERWQFVTIWQLELSATSVKCPAEQSQPIQLPFVAVA
jgi:hypothetical protein